MYKKQTPWPVWLAFFLAITDKPERLVCFNLLIQLYADAALIKL